MQTPYYPVPTYSASEIYYPDYTSSDDYAYPDSTTSSAEYDYTPEPSESTDYYPQPTKEGYYPEPTEAEPAYGDEPTFIIGPIDSDIPTTTFSSTTYGFTSRPETADLPESDTFVTITSTLTSTITEYAPHTLFALLWLTILASPPHSLIPLKLLTPLLLHNLLRATLSTLP
jgi:hypothetical protein